MKGATVAPTNRSARFQSSRQVGNCLWWRYLSCLSLFILVWQVVWLLAGTPEVRAWQQTGKLVSWLTDGIRRIQLFSSSMHLPVLITFFADWGSLRDTCACSRCWSRGQADLWYMSNHANVAESWPVTCFGMKRSCPAGSFATTSNTDQRARVNGQGQVVASLKTMIARRWLIYTNWHRQLDSFASRQIRHD